MSGLSGRKISHSSLGAELAEEAILAKRDDVRVEIGRGRGARGRERGSDLGRKGVSARVERRDIERTANDVMLEHHEAGTSIRV